MRTAIAEVAAQFNAEPEKKILKKLKQLFGKPASFLELEGSRTYSILINKDGSAFYGSSPRNTKPGLWYFYNDEIVVVGKVGKHKRIRVIAGRPCFYDCFPSGNCYSTGVWAGQGR